MEGINGMCAGAASCFALNILPQIEGVQSCICSNPLFNRVTTNWKVILLDCSTIIAVSGFVLAFMSNAAVLTSAFAVLSVASAIGSFYMRRFDELVDLQETTKELRQTKDHFENLAIALENENARLTQASQAIQATNLDLQTRNQDFLATNERLTAQVTSLTVQLTQLQESGERINQEVQRIEIQNGVLNVNVDALTQVRQRLSDQIQTSQALCTQIAQQFSNQDQGIAAQLTQLGTYIQELRAQDGVQQRIQQLGALHEQERQVLDRVNQLERRHSELLGRYTSTLDAFDRLRTQFDQLNTRFANNVSGLSAERTSMQQFFNNVRQVFNSSLGNTDQPTRSADSPMRTGHHPQEVTAV